MPLRRSHSRRWVIAGLLLLAAVPLRSLAGQLGPVQGVGERPRVTGAQLRPPLLLGTAYSLRVWPFFNNSRAYFGRTPLVSTRCGAGSRSGEWMFFTRRCRRRRACRSPGSG